MDDIFGEGADCFNDSAYGDAAAAWRTAVGGTCTTLVVDSPEAVPGLYVIRNYLSADEAEYVLCHILAEGWVAGGRNNQAMAFGTLPEWVRPIQTGFDEFLQRHQEVAYPLKGEPFNQLIANRYEGREGIVKHVDLMKFQDGVFGLTLCGSAALRFAPVVPEASDGAVSEGGVSEYFLSQGDAYLLTGPARYAFTHEIQERDADFDPATKTDVARSMRVSLTLRRLV